MPRIAGDNPSYRFALMRYGPGGRLTSTPWGFDLPSVTTIIKEVIPKPFSAGAWYGYNLAIEGVTKEFKTGGSYSDLRDPALLKKRLSVGGHDPNSVLELSRDRGFVAHDVLELLASGEDEIAEGACEVERQLLGTEYGYSVLSWWKTTGNVGGVKWHPEQPVFSLRLGYAGTADLISGTEIVDLKTHKPASGFTKPSSGPAYLSDLIQLRAYRTAWEEMQSTTTQGNRILIARPNGKWLEDKREVPEALWLQCLEMYKHLKEVS